MNIYISSNTKVLRMKEPEYSQKNTTVRAPKPRINQLACSRPAFPVKAEGIRVDIEVAFVLPEDVELIAPQEVKFWLPKNTPTVVASVKWIIWSIDAAALALVAQKLIVKLNWLAAPPHLGVTTVPSYAE